MSGPRISTQVTQPRTEVKNTSPRVSMQELGTGKQLPRIWLGEISGPAATPTSGGPWLSLGFTLMDNA